MKINRIILLIAIIISFSFSISYSKSDKKILQKNKTENKKFEKLDFNKEPVSFMSAIFRHYHNWELKKGLSLSKKAIILIDKVYSKDPLQIINDPKLKLNKAFQIKSTLHTLKGMLHSRESQHSKKNSVRTENQSIMSKLKKGRTITDKDFEDLTKKIEKNSSTNKIHDSYNVAINEFMIAIKTDKNNPSPHFHLAEVLKKSKNDKIRLKAEQHYFESAKLSIQEGDSKSIGKILKALKNVNAESSYIKKIEDIDKGMKNETH